VEVVQKHEALESLKEDPTSCRIPNHKYVDQIVMIASVLPESMFAAPMLHGTSGVQHAVGMIQHQGHERFGAKL
jgi:hypothetical protein